MSWTPQIRWTEGLEPIASEGYPQARMLGTVEIEGVPHHVEAIEVTEGADGQQRPVAPPELSIYDELAEITDGAMASVAYRGRRYVLGITPYQD